MTVYWCECGKPRRRGEKWCNACRKEKRTARQQAARLRQRLAKNFRPCPASVRERLMRYAEAAFEVYATWEHNGRAMIFASCKEYSENKQLGEGMPAVATPLFWIDYAGPADNPVEALELARERLHRWQPGTAKIPAVFHDAASGPVFVVGEADFWAVAKEWADE